MTQINNIVDFSYLGTILHAVAKKLSQKLKNNQKLMAHIFHVLNLNLGERGETWIRIHVEIHWHLFEFIKGGVYGGFHWPQGL